MKTLKQKSGSSNCVAVVIAMMTDTSVVKVEDLTHSLGFKAPYNDFQFIRIVFDLGFTVGYGLEVTDSSKADWDAYAQAIEVPVWNQLAYVVVKSEVVEGQTHAVFWDGQSVRDPSPQAADERKLSEYDIEKFVPVFAVPEEEN